MSVMFWKVLTAVCLVWYGSITAYVAVRGLGDIRRMLKDIREKGKNRG